MSEVVAKIQPVKVRFLEIAALGKKGGTARAKGMMAERRAEIARRAANKR